MPLSTTVRELRQRLPSMGQQVPESVRGVLLRLREVGFEAYLAGGCVRDLLLGRTADDWDVTTDALPDRVVELFPKVIPTGLQHGTVTVLVGPRPEDKVEVTTYRGEGPYLDGRHPEFVEFISDLDLDLARRDFTVNAIAFDPIEGELRDPFSGVGDLARRRIRAVGDPLARFGEDGLRTLRAVRFASILSFGIDTATRDAIPQRLEVFRKVAKERVKDELTKLLLRSPKPSRGLDLLAETQLLREIIPELEDSRGFQQNRHHRWDVWDHTLRVVDNSPPRLVVRLAALLHDVAKPRCAQETAPGEHSFHGHETVGAELSAQILERLKFPRKVIDQVAHLVREHNWHYEPTWTDGAVRRALGRVGEEAYEDFFALREADLKGRGRAVQSGLKNLAELRARFDAERAKKSALAIKDLAVNGGDLMKESGKGPGPYVGETLRALLQHVLDHPEDNTRERLLELARASWDRSAAPQ